MGPKKVFVSAVLSTALLSLSVVAPAFGASNPEVRVRDECDPVTFDQVLGPGACNPALGGNVTLQQLFAAISQRPGDVLRERNALGWRFNPDFANFKPGTTLHVVSRGGEFHTFTDVTATGFTGGCIPELNAPFGLTPNPQCAGFPAVIPGALPSGTAFDVQLKHEGRQLFQCLIHPWMRSTIDVRP